MMSESNDDEGLGWKRFRDRRTNYSDDLIVDDLFYCGSDMEWMNINNVFFA